MTDKFENYALVIDTNEYAGNFEREMTAHLTGVIGECEVGEELVEEDIEMIFEPVIDQVPDDHGCYRPTSCYPSPGGMNNSVAIFFEQKPTEEHINIIKERLKTFDNAYKTKGRMAQFNKDKPAIEILGLRLIEKNIELNEVVI